MAIGIYSTGGLAFAKEVAIGGVAMGRTAIGSSLRGENLLYFTDIVGSGQIMDFILEHHPHIWRPLLKILTFIGEIASMARIY